jgi:hypothetical protein
MTSTGLSGMRVLIEKCSMRAGHGGLHLKSKLCRLRLEDLDLRESPEKIISDTLSHNIVGMIVHTFNPCCLRDRGRKIVV